MRLLIVEDDVELASALSRGLRDEGFAVDIAHNGEDGLFEARSGEHDLIILDIMLPRFDGFNVLEELRREQSAVPVIFLTARGEIEDRIRGLQLGGDDYLVKPFSFEELLARVRAVLRRSAGAPENRLSCGKLVLDIGRRRVTSDGGEIRLTPREYAILEALLMSKGKVLSRTDIIRHIYDDSYDFDSNIVDAHVAKLRSKIRKAAGTGLIETVRGVGFRIPEEAG